MAVTQLDGRFRSARILLANRLQRAMQTLWNGLGTLPPDAGSQAEFAARAARIVGATQQQAAAATATFLAAKAREAGLDPGTTIDPADYTQLRGVDPGEVYRRPFGAAGTQLAQGVGFGAAMQSGRSRLVKLAATDLQMAHTYSSRDWMSTQSGVVGYRRVLGSGKNCGLCVTASTQRYRTGQLAPIHESCVAGSTLVAGSSVRQFTRRWYDGEIVILRTAQGNELTVTPNHPILTTRGWVAAGSLNEGDDVIRRGSGHRPVSGVPDEYEVPAPVEDRFRAAGMLGLVHVPFASEDFHGDRGDGEVDVVAPDGALWGRGQRGVPKPTEHVPLPVGVEGGVGLPGLCGRHQRSLGTFRTTDGLMRGGRQCGALIGAERSHPGFRDLAHAADLDVRFIENTANRRSGYPKVVSDGRDRLTSSVTVDDLLVGKFNPAGPTAATWLDPTLTEMPNNRRVGTDPDSGRRLLCRLAREVEVDRLVDCRLTVWTGHVYNLRTDNGWYDANGIVTHNCGCTVSPIFGDEDVGQVVDSDRLNAVKSRLEAEDQPYTRQAMSRLDFDADDLPTVDVVQDNELGPRLLDRNWNHAVN